MRNPFGQLIDSIEDGVCFIDSKLRVLHVNEAFRKRFPDATGLSDKKCCHFFSDWLVDCKGCPISNALSTGKRQHRIFAGNGNGDTPSSFEITAVPMPESGKVVDIAVVHVRNIDNVSDRKRGGRKPDEGWSLLPQDNASLTLAAGIAHNFNNALMGISINVDMIRRHTFLADYLGKYVEPIRKSVRSMTRLTEQLMSCVRGGKYQPSSVAVKELVNRVVVLVGNPKCVEMVLDASCDFFVVNVDTDQIQNSLVAILKNALESVEDMSFEGRIQIQCTVDSQLKKIKKQMRAGSSRLFVSISVEDNGKGMDRETRERIFEPFYSTKFHGRGLSMAAAHAIVVRHGGYITVDSKPERGSCVTVFLPAESNRKIPEKQVDGTDAGSVGRCYKEWSY